MPSSIRFALNFSGSGVFDQQRNALRILEETSPLRHVERARLWAILAAAQVFVAPDEAREAADDSAREAGLAESDLATAWALLGACVVDLSCASTPRRLTMTEEILRLARTHGVDELVEPAFLLHLGALAELGRMDELDQAINPTGPLISGFPWLQHGRQFAWFRCLRATIDGDSRAAVEWADRAHGLAQSAGDPDADDSWVGQRAVVAWMQGHVVEFEPLFLQARLQASHEPIWAVSLAWIWLRQGRRSAARALITSLPPVAELPMDRNWLSTGCILAAVAAELDERDIIEPLQEMLAPLAGRCVTIGLGVTCWGTVARPLALMAKALGDLEAAERHYRTCLDVAARMGAHPWLAEAQVELATLLAERGRDGDRVEAEGLAAEAVAAGRALALHEIGSAAEALQRRLRQPDVRSEESPLGPVGRPTINVLGTFEVVAADGSVPGWQSRKARQLLKILIARRGNALSRESVLHMMWPDQEQAVVANRFSVAASTVRRALDPAAEHPRERFLQTSGGLVRLAIENLDIDVELFLAECREVLTAGAEETGDRVQRLTELLALYRGDPFVDEVEETWADELRREVHVAFFAAAHMLGDLALEQGDHLARVEVYRSILVLDSYDQVAHEGLVDALSRSGSHGRAATAHQEYAERMNELGLPVPASPVLGPREPVVGSVGR